MTVADGTETVPVVKGGRAAKIGFAALARLMVPFLVDWYKGDRGDPGGDASQVGTNVAARGMSFSAGIVRIRTTGWNTDGDGGGALYDRWTATMGALPAAGQNVWWFQAADASRWQLSQEQNVTTPMIGALGSAALTVTTIAQNVAIGTDDQPAIQAALNAPMITTLFVTRQHWFGKDIRKPSGKHLWGLNRATCGFHRIPLVGNQVRPTFGIYSEDDDSGSFSDFFVNCQRSGYAGLPADNRQQLLNRCSGLIVRRNSRYVRVLRVDVYNSWGYSHYTCAGSEGNAGPTPQAIIREDCRAYNGDTCFEETGLGLTQDNIDCWGYKDPIDGGPSVYMECGFHTYSGVKQIRRIRCGFRGSAPAVLDAIADGVDSGTIINIDCDFQTSGGQFAITAINPDPQGVGNPKNVGRKILDYRIIRTKAMPDHFFDNGASPQAVLATYANVTIDGGEFGGVGIFAGIEAKITIQGGAVVIATRASGPYVFALYADGTGTIDWYGKAGSVTALNIETPEYAKVASDFGVRFHDLPALSPALAGGAGALPLDKADYPASYVVARRNEEPATERYIPVPDLLTRDATGMVYVGDALATGVTLAMPGQVNIVASGRALLLTSSNGDNYIEQGGIGSGMQFIRGHESIFQVGNVFAGDFHLCTGATNRWTVQAAGHFAAAVDNVYSLGTPALRASVLYAGTGIINTSDEREKTWRGAMTRAERLAARAIVAELGFYQWNDAIAGKGGADARYHYGARAQRVWAIMAEHGLVDPLDADGRPGSAPYAFLCYDQWDDVMEDVMTERCGPPERGKGMDYVKTGERVALPAGNRFGLREGQMTLFLLGALLG
ncbi:hypothetical protein ASF09_07830 [Sphingomonas sp. Leaf242]|nr:hypothetical protein ASF09_07830 [Sphingomonas sp. Leaf242]